MEKRTTDPDISLRAAKEFQRAAANANMTPSEYAALVDIDIQNLYLWRRERSSPNAKTLATMHNAGIDIIYVLTGERSAAPDLVHPKRQE